MEQEGTRRGRSGGTTPGRQKRLSELPTVWVGQMCFICERHSDHILMMSSDSEDLLRAAMGILEVRVPLTCISQTVIAMPGDAGVEELPF